jgi:U3 small nucleolar RNA-associated protein 6
MVYDSIRQDMNDNPHARSYLATRHLFKKVDTPSIGGGDSKYISISDPAFVVALKAAVDEFNTSVKVRNSEL